MNPYNYSITVRRIEDEHEEPCFEARVRELPDVAEYADSFQEAYELAVDTIETTAHALAEQRRKMPSPAPPASHHPLPALVLHRDAGDASPRAPHTS